MWRAWLHGPSSSSLVQTLPSCWMQLFLTDWESHFQVQLHGCWQETLIHPHVGLSRGLLAVQLPPTNTESGAKRHVHPRQEQRLGDLVLARLSLSAMFYSLEGR